jgi:hypothetical protein
LRFPFGHVSSSTVKVLIGEPVPEEVEVFEPLELLEVVLELLLLRK